MSCQRFVPVLESLLGALGLLLCAVGIVGVWAIGTRLSRTNDQMFDVVDKSLLAVSDRVLATQQKINESKVATEEIRQAFASWARIETGERLATRVDVEEKLELLTTGLDRVDQWIEVSTSSVQSVEKLFELANSIGAPVNTGSIESLLEMLASLKGHVEQVTADVGRLRDRSAETAQGDFSDDRVGELVQLIRRVVATFSQIDARLGEFAVALGEVKVRGQHLESRTHRYILMAQAGALLLIAWIAAGQVCLVRHGRSACQPS